MACSSRAPFGAFSEHMLVSWLVLVAFHSVPIRSHGQASPSVRGCPANWAVQSGKKTPGKKAKASAPKASAACIEVAAEALEIQEYLQSLGRKEKWALSDEHLTEDSWVFSRDLSKQELLGATKRNSNSARVEWTAGTATVNVSSTVLPDGFTRTVIDASFRGYGTDADQFAPQKEYWDLESNGNLEQTLTSALKSHFSSKQP